MLSKQLHTLMANSDWRGALPLAIGSVDIEDCKRSICFWLARTIFVRALQIIHSTVDQSNITPLFFFSYFEIVGGKKEDCIV